MFADGFAENEKAAGAREPAFVKRLNGSGKAPSAPMQDQLTGGREIYLVGSAKAQSELMAAHIETKTGLHCRLVENLEAATQSIRQNGHPVLLLRDCHRKSNETILAELRLVYHGKLSWALCCLYNLTENTGLELDAVEYGVKGFFYEHDQLENLLRGIHSVFQGEIWLSRKTMSEYIKRRSGPQKITNEDSVDSQLTRRELEILSKLAGGSSNQNIAETLYISRHTVKTHIYNIYKKIGVSDRLQAALWAAKNL